jgi:hypothetical protein
MILKAFALQYLDLSLFKAVPLTISFLKLRVVGILKNQRSRLQIITIMQIILPSKKRKTNQRVPLKSKSDIIILII